MLISDATPLIPLATVDQVALLAHPTAACVIPKPGYWEVVTAGVDTGHPDARRIEQAVENGVKSVVSVDEIDGLKNTPKESGPR